MIKNLEKYKSDLSALIKRGDMLHLALQFSCFPAELKKQAKEVYGDGTDALIAELPSFESEYQK